MTSKEALTIHRATTAYKDFDQKDSLLVTQVPGEPARLQLSSVWEDDAQVHRDSVSITLSAEQWEELARTAFFRSIEMRALEAEGDSPRTTHQNSSQAALEAVREQEKILRGVAMRILRRLYVRGEGQSAFFPVDELSEIRFYLREIGRYSNDFYSEVRSLKVLERLQKEGLIELDEGTTNQVRISEVGKALIREEENQQ